MDEKPRITPKQLARLIALFVVDDRLPEYSDHPDHYCEISEKILGASAVCYGVDLPTCPTPSFFYRVSFAKKRLLLLDAKIELWEKLG